MKSNIWKKTFRGMVHLLILRPLVRYLFGVHVTGWEHFRSLNRYIIIANHNSHLDVVLLFYLLATRDLHRTHAVGERTYFERSKWIFRCVGFLFQPIWIQRGAASRHEDTLKGCREALTAGHNLVLFPEGTRGAPGELIRFKSGIGRLVEDFPSIPIIPVFLSGPERVLPKKCAIPLPFWNHIVVGPPQLCHGKHQEITRYLQANLQRLSTISVIKKRKRQPQVRPITSSLAILGIDGSGKSSISAAMAKKRSQSGRSCLVGDQLTFFENGEVCPLQPSGLESIRRIVARHAKRAGSLKSYKIPKLTELLMRDRLLLEVNRWYAVRWIIQDGSPLLNMAAWAALYPGHHEDDMLLDGIAVMAGRKTTTFDQNQVYEHFPEIHLLARLGLTQLRLPDAFVLLDLEPAIALSRIQQRGKAMQVHETPDKLHQLRKAYLRVQELVSRQWQIPTLLLDATHTQDELTNEIELFTEATFKTHASVK